MSILDSAVYVKGPTFHKQAAQIESCGLYPAVWYGWQEKGMGKPGQPRCSMGALASAHSMRQWDENLAQIMYDSLYKELNGLTLTQYNHKFQDGERIARLYEKVAYQLKSDPWKGA